jgi:hypothetical protein
MLHEEFGMSVARQNQADLLPFFADLMSAIALTQ